jgi:hypothetical protein
MLTPVDIKPTKSAFKSANKEAGQKVLKDVKFHIVEA